MLPHDDPKPETNKEEAPERSSPGPSDASDRSGSHGSGTGLEPNVAGALSYLLGLITGVLFLVLEKERPTVQYHAYQSIGFSVIWIVLSIATTVLGVVPVIGWLIGGLLGIVITLGGLALWLYLMWQAFRGNEPELPVVGPWARDQVEGGGPTV